jgi:hypothetical protein
MFFCNAFFNPASLAFDLTRSTTNYLDSTPTHSYIKYLYRYPQARSQTLRPEHLDIGQKAYSRPRSNQGPLRRLSIDRSPPSKKRCLSQTTVVLDGKFVCLERQCSDLAQIYPGEPISRVVFGDKDQTP